MTSEKEMLMGSGEGRSPFEGSVRKRRHVFKRVLLGLLAAAVVLAVLVALFGPTVAARFVPARSTLSVAGRPCTLGIGDVSLSWRGPQRVGSITLEDSSGQRMADLTAEADTSLVSVVFGGRDFGTVRLKGTIDVRESQLASGAVATPPLNPPVTGAAPSGPGGPLTLPAWLSAKIEASGVGLSYTRDGPGGDGGVVRVTGLNAALEYKRGSEIALDLVSSAPAVSVTVRAKQLVDSAGVLTLERAEIDANVSVSLDGELVESLARAALGVAGTPGAPAVEGKLSPLTLAARAQVRGGRLMLASAAHPIMVQTGVPRAAVGALSRKGAEVRLTASPVVSAWISALDVPLSGAGREDWRTASIKASLTATETAGTVRLSGDDAARAFTIAPVAVELDGTSLVQQALLTGKTSCTLDGKPAGSVDLKARAREMVGSDGALVRGLPGKLEGELAVRDIPTALLEPLARAAGLPLRESVGDVVNLRVTALTRAESTGPTGSGAPTVTELTAELAAPLVTANAIVAVTPDRLWSDGRAVRFEGSRPGPIVRALAGDRIRLEGDGMFIGEISDLDVPLVSGLPDAGRSAGRFRLSVGAFGAPGLLPERTIDLQSLDTEVRLKPGAPVEVALDHRIAVLGELTRATGTVRLDGLLKRRDGDWPWVEIDTAAVRPEGAIEVTGLPRDLWGLAGERIGMGLAAALGTAPKLDLKASPAPGGGAGATALAFTLVSAEAQGSGALVLSSSAVRGGEDALRLTLRNPGPLVGALAGGRGELSDVRTEGPLDVRLVGVDAPLSATGGAPGLAALEGRLMLETPALSASLAAQGGARTVKASKLLLEAAQSRERGASVRVSGSGALGEEPFSLEGDMSFGRLFDGQGRFSLAGFSPAGRVLASKLPVGLVGAFLAEYGDAARELLGETADVALIAPAPEKAWAGAAVPKGPSAGLSVTGANARAESALALDGGKTLRTGLTTMEGTLTPRLVEVLVEKFAQGVPARPGLGAPARVKAMVQPVSVDLGADGAPDIQTLRPMAAMVTADSDVVLVSLPGGPEGGLLSVGLRGLTMGVAYDRQDPVKSESSVRAALFNPAEPGAVVLNARALSSTQFPPAHFEATLSAIDTARADRLLGRPGLLAEALGETAGLTIEAPLMAGRRERPISVAIESPRMRGGATIEELADRYALAEPAELAWEMPESWANRYLVPPARDGRAPGVQFDGATRLSLGIEGLTVAKGEGPLKPGVFSLKARASSPEVALKTAKGVRVLVKEIVAEVQTTKNPAELGFTLSARSQREGGGSDEQLTASGTVAGIADGSGRPTPGAAALTCEVKGAAPTAVLDALARYDGLLTDLLGATTKVDIRTEALSRGGGRLRANAITDNTDARIAGDVRPDGVFATDEPAVVRLRRITPELSDRALERVLPILSRVTKTEKNEPAVVEAAGLELPTDGDLTKLNGVVRADLGTVEFQTSSFFGQLLKAGNQKTGGRIGDKIKPFEFVITKGVVKYDRIEVPIGEFSVVTRGTVDLPQRKLDIVTFIPFYAVADELAGVFGKTPGLDRLAMVPIRTRGSFDKPKSELDPTLILEEGLPGAAKEGVGGILQGVGGLLDGMKKKQEEDKQKKDEKKKKKKEQQKSQQP